jgi:hypothetical protein
VFSPPYPFALDTVDDVKSLVTDPVKGAGNRLSEDSVRSEILSLDEEDLSPWFKAQAFPASDGEGTIIQAASTDGPNELNMVARLDIDGNWNGRVMAEDVGTELVWTSNANYVLAHRFTPDHDGLILKMAETSEGLSTLFEKTLVLSNSEADLAVLSKDRFSIVQDSNEGVRVALFANADVLWSYLYAASEFSMHPQKQLGFHDLPEGYLLSIIDSDREAEGTTTPSQSNTILIGLDLDGVPLWSNVYAGLASPYAANVVTAADGGIFLVRPDDPVTGSIVTKLDSQGQFVWCRYFPVIDVQVHAIGSIAGNKTLIAATELDEQGKRQPCYALVDENGSVEKQVHVLADEFIAGTAIASEDRIWYTLSINDQNEPGPVYEGTGLVVGSSSLALDDWQWAQYNKPASSGMVWPRTDGSLFFSAFHIDTGSLDLMALTQAFDPGLFCTVFNSVGMQVEENLKTTSPVTIDDHPIAVAQTPWIPQFVSDRMAPSISLRNFKYQASPICMPESQPSTGRPARR